MFDSLPRLAVGWPHLSRLVQQLHMGVIRFRGQEKGEINFSHHPTRPYKCLMSSKKQKMTSKRGRASEEPAHSYDHDNFFNESAIEKFRLISKNRSFINEKGFHHPNDFFRKTIANRRWQVLC